MELYVVINNNHEIDNSYQEWIDGIYSTKAKALAGASKCKKELIKELQEIYQEQKSERITRTLNILLKTSPIMIKIYILDSRRKKSKYLTLDNNML